MERIINGIKYTTQWTPNDCVMPVFRNGNWELAHIKKLGSVIMERYLDGTVEERDDYPSELAYEAAWGSMRN